MRVQNRPVIVIPILLISLSLIGGIIGYNWQTIQTKESEIIPTTTLMEGAMVAALVGQKYIAYRPTLVQCDQAVESGDVEGCVAPDKIELLNRSEWEQLLPGTHFYHFGFAGRNKQPEYDHSYNYELVAWHGGRYYTSANFDELLEANGVNSVTDENRELVAKSVALMTLEGYLKEKITISSLNEVDIQGGFSFEHYNYALTVWTKLEGFKIEYLFMFESGHLRVMSGRIRGQETGDYIDVIDYGDVVELPNNVLRPPSLSLLEASYWR